MGYFNSMNKYELFYHNHMFPNAKGVDFAWVGIGEKDINPHPEKRVIICVPEGTVLSADDVESMLELMRFNCGVIDPKEWITVNNDGWQDEEQEGYFGQYNLYTKKYQYTNVIQSDLTTLI